MIFLGIDGGGSSCKALAVDSAGAVVFEGRGGPTNWRSTPREDFCANLWNALEGCPEPDAIGACFAGVLGPADQEAIWEILGRKYDTVITVAADYEAAFRSCPPGTSACIIAGTGSVVVSAHGVAGGGGALLGDVGSAFDLVRLGLQRLVYEGRNEGGNALPSPSPQEGEVRERSERGGGTRDLPPSPSLHSGTPPCKQGGELGHLAQILRERFGTLARAELTFAILNTKSPQAELASMIHAFGCDVAESSALQEIVIQRFRTLLETAYRIAPPTHIGLCGGVWDAHPIFVELMERLTRDLPGSAARVTIGKPDVPPVMGAVRLAQQFMQ